MPRGQAFPNTSGVQGSGARAGHCLEAGRFRAHTDLGGVQGGAGKDSGTDVGGRDPTCLRGEGVASWPPEQGESRRSGEKKGGAAQARSPVGSPSSWLHHPW